MLELYIYIILSTYEIMYHDVFCRLQRAFAWLPIGHFPHSFFAHLDRTAELDWFGVEQELQQVACLTNVLWKRVIFCWVFCWKWYFFVVAPMRWIEVIFGDLQRFKGFFLSSRLKTWSLTKYLLIQKGSECLQDSDVNLCKTHITRW